MSKNSHVKHEHKNKKKQQDMSYEKPHEDYHAGFLGDIIIGLLILGLGLVFVILRGRCLLLGFSCWWLGYL